MEREDNENRKNEGRVLAESFGKFLSIEKIFSVRTENPSGYIYSDRFGADRRVVYSDTFEVMPRGIAGGIFSSLSLWLFGRETGKERVEYIVRRFSQIYPNLRYEEKISQTYQGVASLARLINPNEVEVVKIEIKPRGIVGYLNGRKER